MSAAQKVTENVKQAREQALVGCYDDAKVFYGGAIQGIQKMMKEKQDPDTNEKWKQVSYSQNVVTARMLLWITIWFLQALGMLSDELELVSSLTSTLASFKEDPSVAAGGAAGGGRHKFTAAVSKPEREDHHTRDPDIWPPPTPIESR